MTDYAPTPTGAPPPPLPSGGYPPPPPARDQQQYYPAPQLGAGLQVTAIVAGIFGVIFGLIPLTFLLAWAFGLVALVVGIMAHRRAKAVGRKQGRAGMVMGAIALRAGDHRRGHCQQRVRRPRQGPHVPRRGRHSGGDRRMQLLSDESRATPDAPPPPPALTATAVGAEDFEGKARRRERRVALVLCPLLLLGAAFGAGYATAYDNGDELAEAERRIERQNDQIDRLGDSVDNVTSEWHQEQAANEDMRAEMQQVQTDVQEQQTALDAERGGTRHPASRGRRAGCGRRSQHVQRRHPPGGPRHPAGAVPHRRRRLLLRGSHRPLRRGRGPHHRQQQHQRSRHVGHRLAVLRDKRRLHVDQDRMTGASD